MQIWNGSDEYCWRYRADTILSTDGQTDRLTDGQGDTNIPPFQLRWSGGIISTILCSTVEPKISIFMEWWYNFDQDRQLFPYLCTYIRIRTLKIHTPKLGFVWIFQSIPDSRVHGANMGPIWVLSAPGGPMLAPWTLLSGMFFRDAWHDTWL